MVAGLTPDQRIVRQGKGLPVPDRIRDAASRLHQIEKAIGESENDTLGRRRAVVGRREQPANGARETGDLGPAAEAVSFHQHTRAPALAAVQAAASPAAPPPTTRTSA